MKKSIFSILTIIGAIIAISSCSKTETYADKLKDERKAISRFLSQHDIEVLNKFPGEFQEFKPNQYFKDEVTGVYFRVDDWGKGDSIQKNQDVFLRYKKEFILLVSKDTLPGNTQSEYWIKATYGVPTSYTKSSIEEDKDYYALYLLSPGSILPLEYGIRNGGRVSLIIPFSNGSYTQQSQYEPAFVEELNYRFD